MGLKEQRERQNKSKVTQELVEEKKRKRVTYTNEERSENNKVKEWEKLGKRM